MKIELDVHTHTIASGHAFSTLQEMAQAAADKGLKDVYKRQGVKAGLRDENGKGVLAGLTNISDIRAFQYVDGVKKPEDRSVISTAKSSVLS